MSVIVDIWSLGRHKQQKEIVQWIKSKSSRVSLIRSLLCVLLKSHCRDSASMLRALVLEDSQCIEKAITCCLIEFKSPKWVVCK